MVADTPPYSVVRSFTAPDMQMVVVPPTSTNATIAMAMVSFMGTPCDNTTDQKTGARADLMRALAIKRLEIGHS
ncbi:hypothetical protein EOS_29505 [Caballeronia mineralivorans PML1(12)]|uniref:Uncharacterized protein n=1 Tax=Caballeronia mineralivorans PML1(12) TaxID=908627 RepID=A0A0J1CPS7_9BURK|nr:hypothetical protein EOS_29505 [Caballeronia mineralivorans PML1(12)]